MKYWKIECAPIKGVYSGKSIKHAFALALKKNKYPDKLAVLTRFREQKKDGRPYVTVPTLRDGITQEKRSEYMFIDTRVLLKELR